MKIVLKQEVDNLGEPGDVVEVKSGYARNFLIPRQMALQATPQNLKAFEQDRKRIELVRNKDKREAEVLAGKMNGVSVNAAVAVGEEDKVFGSVTSQNIADLLAEKGFEVDRRKILLDEPLKALGSYDVAIKLHSEVEATVKVWVVKE